MPPLAVLDIEDVPQCERDRILIEDEELHLLTESYVLEAFCLLVSRVFVIVVETMTHLDAGVVVLELLEAEPADDQEETRHTGHRLHQVNVGHQLYLRLNNELSV